jgi:hypothetical protein
MESMGRRKPRLRRSFPGVQGRDRGVLPAGDRSVGLVARTSTWLRPRCTIGNRTLDEFGYGQAQEGSQEAGHRQDQL